MFFAFNKHALPVRISDVIVLALEIALLALAVSDGAWRQLRALPDDALRVPLASVVEGLTAKKAYFLTLLARAPELEVTAGWFLEVDQTCSRQSASSLTISRAIQDSHSFFVNDDRSICTTTLVDHASWHNSTNFRLVPVGTVVIFFTNSFSSVNLYVHHLRPSSVVKRI
jgi:hypothetical protein